MKNNRVDVVYDFLKKKGELVEFMDLYKELAKKDKRFKLDDFMLVSQLYTDIIIDGRFIILREEVGKGKNKKEVHKCGIRDNYTYEEIKESISRFGDVILDTRWKNRRYFKKKFLLDPIEWNRTDLETDESNWRNWWCSI